MRSRALRGTVVVAALSAGVSACAAIWGFQDATDLVEGGSTASSTAGPSSVSGGATASSFGTASSSSAGTIDATVGDGGSDATLGDGGAENDAPAADAGSASDADGGGDAGAEDAEIEGGGEAGGPACECAPPIPPAPGWIGPFEIAETAARDGGADAAAPVLPSCGDDGTWISALDLHAVPSAQPAACSCACEAPSGGLCAAPEANYFSDLSCKTACTRMAPTPLGPGCTPLAGSGPNCATAHIALSAALVDAGACVATGSSTPPPVLWDVSARLCSPATTPAGTCASGTCVPPRDSNFEMTYCIVHAGATPCPTTEYAVHRTYDDAGDPYFADASDERRCGACGCQAPTGVTCEVDASTGTVGFGGVCYPAGPYTDAACTPAPTGPTSVTASAAPSGGSCLSTADGGQVTGEVTPTAPYTVCCTQ